jgi:hypothetical protein
LGWALLVFRRSQGRDRDRRGTGGGEGIGKEGYKKNSVSEKEGAVEERFGMRDIKLRNIGRKRKAWRLGIVGVQGLVHG